MVEGLHADDPSMLGLYRLEGRIDADDTGVVYLGASADGVRARVMALRADADDEVRARMSRRTEALASVHSRRVAGYMGADTIGPVPWLAVRHVPGPTLSEVQVPLDEQALGLLAGGLAEALHALHAAGLTHGHVSPANVVLTEDGPVLIGIGAAGPVAPDSPGDAGSVVGPTVWAAPEQRRGEPVGPPGDVWGWGAVLTYAATGQPPLSTTPRDDETLQVADGVPPVEPILPGWLRGPVTVALAEDPAARPAAWTLAMPGAGPYPGLTTTTLPSTLARRPLWRTALIDATGLVVAVGLGAIVWLGLDLTGRGPEGNIPIEQVATGDCVQNPTDYAGRPLEIWDGESPMPDHLTVVPCAEPHAGEVFFAGDLWDWSAAYPGDEVVRDEAEAHCGSVYEEYVGAAAPAGSVFPQTSSWRQGNRRVVCVALDFDGGLLEGSIERRPGTDFTMRLLERMEPGDCVLTPEAYADDPMTFWATDAPWPASMAVVPCDQPHAAEVFFAEDLWDDDAPRPTDEAVLTASESRCDSAFEDFVGVSIDESRLAYVWWLPQESWEYGDRRVGCMALDPAADTLTTTLQGSRQ